METSPTGKLGSALISLEGAVITCGVAGVAMVDERSVMATGEDR